MGEEERVWWVVERVVKFKRGVRVGEGEEGKGGEEGCVKGDWVVGRVGVGDWMGEGYERG